MYLLRTRNWEDEDQGMGNGVLEAGDGNNINLFMPNHIQKPSLRASDNWGVKKSEFYYCFTVQLLRKGREKEKRLLAKGCPPTRPHTFSCR